MATLPIFHPSKVLTREHHPDRQPSGEGKLSRLLRPVSRLFDFWPAHSSHRTWHRVRLNLGRRMWAEGIEDGALGARINELEAKINLAGLVGISVRELENELTDLFLQLADLALEDAAPLPGAESEYRAAREVQAARARAGSASETVLNPS